MIYLLFGLQKIIIDRQLKKIINELYEVQDEFNIVKFSASETLLQDIIYEASLLPLGYERKAIIVEEANFFVNEKFFDGKDEEVKALLEYFLHPNEATDLFFIVDSGKLNEKSKHLIALKNTEHKIFEAQNITKEDWPRYVEMYFRKNEASITKEASEELINRIQANALLFTQEANKLMVYAKHIELDDVKLLVARPLEENVFAIADSLIKNKKNVAMKIYQDLLGENGEPIRLISLMASQFRILSQIAYLKSQQMTNLEIAKELEINDYRVKLGIQNLNLISGDKVLDVLQQLANLDLKIKSGEIDRFYGLEMFLLNF